MLMLLPCATNLLLHRRNWLGAVLEATLTMFSADLCLGSESCTKFMVTEELFAGEGSLAHPFTFHVFPFTDLPRPAFPFLFKFQTPSVLYCPSNLFVTYMDTWMLLDFCDWQISDHVRCLRV
jgi:hypothetical protein